MKISKMIDLLIYFKKEYGDIEIAKCSSFVGSDIIDSAFVHEDKLIFINSDKESYLLKFVKDDIDVL